MSGVVFDGAVTFCAVHPGAGWSEGRDPRFTCAGCARGAPPDAARDRVAIEGTLARALGLPGGDRDTVAEMLAAIGLPRV